MILEPFSSYLFIVLAKQTRKVLLDFMDLIRFSEERKNDR